MASHNLATQDHTHALAVPALRIDICNADHANGSKQVMVCCNECALDVGQRYYDCWQCGSGQSYTLCATCNANHRHATRLVIAPNELQVFHSDSSWSSLGEGYTLSAISTQSSASATRIVVHPAQSSPVHECGAADRSPRTDDKQWEFLSRQDELGGADAIGASSERDLQQHSQPEAAPSSSDAQSSRTDTPKSADDCDFVLRCLLSDSLSQADQHQAVETVSGIATRLQTPQFTDRCSHQSVCSGKASDVTELRRSVTELTEKLTAMEGQIGGLLSHAHTQADACASVSDVYSKELLRVKQESTATVQRMDALCNELQAEVAARRSENANMLTAHNDTLAALRQGFEAGVPTNKAAREAEKQKHVSLDLRLRDTFRNLLDTTGKDVKPQAKEKWTAEQVSEVAVDVEKAPALQLARSIKQMRDDQDRKLTAQRELLEKQLSEHKQSQRKEVNSLEAIVAELQSKRNAESLKSSALPVCPSALDQSTIDSIHCETKELRATTTSLDNEIKAAHTRLGKLEHDGRKGLSEKRLDDLEFQLADLASNRSDQPILFHANPEFAESIADVKRRHGAFVATCWKDWATRDDKARNVNASIEKMREEITRLEDVDKGIVGRLDGIELRLPAPQFKPFTERTRSPW